jgi:hypothetical protein
MILLTVAGVLLTAQAVHAQGFYGPRHPPGYGPPPGYGGAGYYGMAGCGLGALVFGPVNTPGAQILAATTNATLGSQTFGITSGTSNCVSGGVIAAGRAQAAFAEVTFDDLKRDMAAGGGEFLSSFATLLGCEPAARPELARMTQAHYEALLPSESTTPIELVVHVKSAIAADPVLAASCSDERAMARSLGKPAKSSTGETALAAVPSTAAH